MESLNRLGKSKFDTLNYGRMDNFSYLRAVVVIKDVKTVYYQNFRTCYYPVKVLLIGRKVPNKVHFLILEVQSTWYLKYLL